MCTFQVGKRRAASSTASPTARARPSSPPATRSAAAAGAGWLVCRPALWMSVVPLRTAPTRSTFAYRGNAANSGCVRTWRTPSSRTPSQVGHAIFLASFLLWPLLWVEGGGCIFTNVVVMATVLFLVYMRFVIRGHVWNILQEHFYVLAWACPTIGHSRV